MSTFFCPNSAPRCHYTQIGSTRIYSEVHGSGEPLVLIHGLGGSTRWWSRNKRALAQRHEVHLIDMAGFGRSNGRFVLHEAAQQLAEWSERCGLGPMSVIGHSLGGYIAAHLAARHPQLVSHLVLVGAALSSPDLPRAGAKVQGPPVPLSMMPLVLGDVARAGVGVMARVAYELVRCDVRETLAQIRARTLLVWGERDGAVPIEVGRAAVKQIPGARMAVICNAGHAPMWEQPLAFNHTVLSFLAGQPIRSQVP